MFQPHFLALVGNKLEKPTIVKELLDVEKYPRRPSYKYANPDGLVLIDCEYENVMWIDGEDQSKFLASKLENKMYNMKIGLSVHELIKVRKKRFFFTMFVRRKRSTSGRTLMSLIGR